MFGGKYERSRIHLVWFVRGVEEWIAIVVREEEGQIGLIWKCFRKVNGRVGVRIVAEVGLCIVRGALEVENIGVLWGFVSWRRRIMNSNSTSLSFFFFLGDESMI